MSRLHGWKRSLALIPVLGTFLPQVVCGASPVPTSAPLSQVMTEEISGLAHLEAVTPDAAKLLNEHTVLFIQARRGGKHSAAGKKLRGMCEKDAGASVYCRYQDKPRRTPSSSESLATRGHTPPMKTILMRIRKGDVAAVKELSEGVLIKSMRHFGDWRDLDSAITKATDPTTCTSTALLTALGLKMEEFFPAPEVKARAIKLYSRAVECGGLEDSSAYKSRYRLSLLLIWENRCKEADPHLALLADKKDGDFATRGLYWRVQCAEKMGNKPLAKSLREQMKRDFPLSFHGLALSPDPDKEVLSFLKRPEPRVSWNSVSSPELNEQVRAAELLISRKANDLASEVIDSVEEQLTDKTEIPFRLYIAVLARRSGNFVEKFKLMGGIFRTDPNAITRQTMELFYPLNRFDVLQTHKAKADPFLMAALIRQESAFNERATSRVGARGLMQLMPNTARRMERVSKNELFDAKTNIRLGTRYFSMLMDRFDSDVELSLAAYNAGSDRVVNWKVRYPTDNRLLFLDLIPFSETRNYVALIVRNFFWYQNLYGDRMIGARAPAGKINSFAPQLTEVTPKE